MQIFSDSWMTIWYSHDTVWKLSVKHQQNKWLLLQNKSDIYLPCSANAFTASITCWTLHCHKFFSCAFTEKKQSTMTCLYRSVLSNSCLLCIGSRKFASTTPTIPAPLKPIWLVSHWPQQHTQCFKKTKPLLFFLITSWNTGQFW